MENKTISGFSKLSKEEKMKWVAQTFFDSSKEVTQDWQQFWHPETAQQKIIDGFSENTISNYVLPYGVAPNFVINGQNYTVPMVIEESSVVAAASSAAKFWLSRGGFRTQVLSTVKLGQVHFGWTGSPVKLKALWDDIQQKLLEDSAVLTANMEKRGGGILGIELLDMTDQEPDYYQIRAAFETCDSMGANFINSVLESFALSLEEFMDKQPALSEEEREVEIVMAILSNYTPQCLVRASVECPIEKLKGAGKNMEGAEFARKFAKAVRIAHIDPHRATTHNKGIFNGIDAVVLATANDFRAIEACGHTYASRDGQYRSLSHCTVENGIFKFWLDIPLAVGTVGGLTKLHPLAKRSLELLGNPSAPELMQIIAATGLAQNFAALRSLVTTGIQKGHMKMHLKNILIHLEASEKEVEASFRYFQDRVVSYSGVRDFLRGLRRASRINMEITIQAETEMADVAAQILETAGTKRKFAFYGEIGAGKTTLIQAICQLLKVEDYVTSPTFALVNVYEAPGGPIYHLDLYRLKNVEEALDIGIEEYLYDEAYCFIEWPELVELLLPDDVLRIKITFLAESSRKILFL